jgi:hypothetical protein
MLYFSGRKVLILPRAYKDGNSFISVNQILQLANGECLRLFFLLLANQVN